MIPKLYDTSKFTIKTYNRLFLYNCGDEVELPGQSKLGQRFVKAGDDPNVGCEIRVKQVCGQFWKKYEPNIFIENIYDVTDWAKDVYRGDISDKKKFDDYIRPKVGGHQAGTEIHTIDPKELNYRLNNLITKRGLAKPVADLNTAQYMQTVNVINSLKFKNVLLLNFCARYGKTITSLIPALEMKIPLVIIASYVNTVFASFKNDISNFDNFKNFVIVETKDSDYQKQVNEYLKQGKKVVAFASLHKSKNRDGRIDFLMNKKLNKHLVVDEADYGAHKSSQSKILIDSYNKNISNTKVMLMTGTNADRAMGEWPIDDTIQITYPELLSLRFSSTKSKKKLIDNSLKTFNWDDKRDSIICPINFYQVDYSVLIDECLKEKKLSNDMRENPSLKAINANPIKNEPLLFKLFSSMYDGKHPQLNISDQTQNYSGDKRVEMAFVNARNSAIKIIGNVAHDALNDHNVAVLTLSGKLKYKGKTFKQENVEEYVKDFIRDNKDKNILIISNFMAQRSFSIPEIQNLYLMYDGGQVGSTIQKISRVLTAGSADKIANVISMSLDPNREDKIIDFVVESARSLIKNTKNTKTLIQAMQEVLACMPIYEFGKDGNRVKLEIDEYLEKVASKNGMEKVFGRTADLSKVSSKDIMELARSGGYNSTKTKVFSKGKVKDVKRMTKKMSANIRDNRPEKLARAALVNIFNNLWQLSVYSNKRNLVEAIDYCIKDKDALYGIKKSFGIDLNLIKRLNNAGSINQESADVLINNYHYRQKEIIRKKTVNESS
jgi:hypothetical protein